MKTISELTDFYYKTLYPILQTLEEERKRLKKRVITIALLYTFILSSIFLFIFKHFDFETFTYLIFFTIAGFAGIYKYLLKDYTADFKQKVIAPLIQEIDKNLDYLPELHIPLSNFTHSKLFTSHPNRVSGNDYVRGKIDNIEIAFSDLHVEKKEKNSKGQTVILPDSAQSIFGDLIGGWLQANNVSRNQLIRMDNPEFEREFVVYGTDQIEARYILTHTLMQKLILYKKRTKHPLYISFIEGKIYMAIEYNSDMFEPSVFRSLLEYKIAMEYIETLHLALGIVEELQLNQKLWSKI